MPRGTRMGFSLSGIHKELSSRIFSHLYDEIRMTFPPLHGFPSILSLILFFHDERQDYQPKDQILFHLAALYRRSRQYHLLASFFIALFTPAIASLYRLARKRCHQLDDEDFIQEVCASLLQIIKGKAIAPHKVAAQIIGQLKNSTRDLIDNKLERDRREISGGMNERDPHVLDDGEPDDNHSPALAGNDEPSEIFPQGYGKHGYDIPDAEVFLDRLVRSGVIEDADREMLIATVLEGRLLKDIVSDTREYQRLRKRRQRILLVIRKHTTKSLK